MHANTPAISSEWFSIEALSVRLQEAGEYVYLYVDSLPVVLDSEAFAQEQYIAFRNRVVGQLKCDDSAACWHLIGEEVDITVKKITDDVVALPDGGSPTLPENWRSISRPRQRVFQRVDRDHYIVLGDGNDEVLVVLCSQGDRSYPAPLASRRVSERDDVQGAIREFAVESNELIEPADGGNR